MSIRKSKPKPRARAASKSNGTVFTVVIEQDEDGFLVGSVPALQGCHTQARTLDQLMKRVREAIELCLEDDPALRASHQGSSQFVGVQRIAV